MIPVYRPSIGDTEKRYVLDALDSTWISSRGPYLTRFESDFANYVGAAHGVAVANGTVALHLALLAAGVGPGDEVVVPTFTYVASVNAIRYCGATPVFVDSDPSTWNLDPERVAAAITSRTKAIEVVHLYGHPADLDPLVALAGGNDLVLIEDAAEAHGARYRGRPVGSVGDVGSFSFFGNKIVTTGEGGMLVTDRQDLAERARHLRGQGVSRTRTYWHDVVGYNYRMTNVAAAIGCAQLERIEDTLKSKRAIAAWYREELVDTPGVELQTDAPWAEPVYWMNSILVDPGVRDALRELLARDGIETRPFFYPAHTLPMYQTSERFPVAERLAASGINLPSFAELRRDEVQKVAHSVRTNLAQLS